MFERLKEFRCSECDRGFKSIRALHSHESLTEIPRIAKRLCNESPGRCKRNWISGRCETHFDEAVQIVRARQRKRYVDSNKQIPQPLKTNRRRPAMERLVGHHEY